MIILISALMLMSAQYLVAEYANISWICDALPACVIVGFIALVVITPTFVRMMRESIKDMRTRMYAIDNIISVLSDECDNNEKPYMYMEYAPIAHNKEEAIELAISTLANKVYDYDGYSSEADYDKQTVTVYKNGVEVMKCFDFVAERI